MMKTILGVPMDKIDHEFLEYAIPILERILAHHIFENHFNMHKTIFDIEVALVELRNMQAKMKDSE